MRSRDENSAVNGHDKLDKGQHIVFGRFKVMYLPPH